MNPLATTVHGHPRTPHHQVSLKVANKQIKLIIAKLEREAIQNKKVFGIATTILEIGISLPTYRSQKALHGIIAREFHLQSHKDAMK
jgi:hypothetical protein